MPSSSIATLHAQHIEKARKPFFLSFTRSAYFNVYLHASERRLVRVLAETEHGARQVLRYHYSDGIDAHLETASMERA